MRLITLITVCLLPALAGAQSLRPSDEVLNVLRLDALLEILQEEAVVSGEELATSMMPGRSLRGWRDTVARINDPQKVAPEMRDAFAGALDDTHIAPVLDFLQSELGHEVTGLELAARELMTDPDVEAEILDSLGGAAEARPERFAQVEDFVEINDLIDANVVGALNANVAFLQGLRDGARRGLIGGRDDAGLLAEVWEQEPEIRASTEEWILGFLMLAYQPLADEDLAEYIAFSDTEAGQALNKALFAAFDALFVSTSYETGEALARLIASEDL